MFNSKPQLENHNPDPQGSGVRLLCHLQWEIYIPLVEQFLAFPRQLSKMVDVLRKLRPSPKSSGDDPSQVILRGRRVVALDCKGIHISGSFYRNKLWCLVFFHKHINTNLFCEPSTSDLLSLQGPHYFMAPICIFWQNDERHFATQDQVRPSSPELPQGI